MLTTPVHPDRSLGARVTDVRLDALGPDDHDALRGLLAEHGVLVLPEQEVDDDTFTTFLRGFGDLAFTVGETPVEGHPDLNLISNVGRTTPPRSTFHVDTSYVARPPAYTALRAVTVPERGGQTLFSDQYAACRTLPERLRTLLDGRTITHVVTGLDLDDDAETSAEHPVFRPHPVTGQVALYLTTPARCASISGLDDATAAEVVQELYDHSTQESNLYRHRWAPGDVVMWDNACVLHKADHSGVSGDRIMHRGMVGSYGRAA